MYLSILLPSVFALFALWKKKVTKPGIIAAWLMGVIITYFGGLYAFGALALTFVLTISSDKIKKKTNDECRTIYQMFSNVLLPTICIVLYHFTLNDKFYVMYYAVLSSSLADTLASSIGTLSKNRPVSIFTLKRVPAGTSGAVSFLGINASLAGGIILGLIYYAEKLNSMNYLLIILMGLFGSIADSLLGDSLQGKFVCSKCKKEVEEYMHCGEPTKLVKGLYWMNNDAVNLLNNVFVFILCYIFLL
jgi:uncharacterized protein (TIGR00297 family)